MIGNIRLSYEQEFTANRLISKYKIRKYRVGVTLNGAYDSKNGLFVDFEDINSIIERFDNSCLNDFFKIPSVENLSRYFALKIIRLTRNILEATVSVYETDRSVASSTISNPVGG